MNIPAINDFSVDTSSHNTFNEKLKQHDLFALKREDLNELQINLGYLCNQACEHCHVEAGPNRREMMTIGTMSKILAWMADNEVVRADLTGGAPELIPGFRDFVDGLLELGVDVTSRCNLTVLFEPNQEDLACWYGKRKIRLACSLPCYTAENVEAQRGKGVFDKSIRALQALNEQGYGRAEDLILDLVYNPIGPTLPPPQASLEEEYKAHLKADFGIDFNNLLTITNLPIKRFEHFLERTGQLESYQQLLMDNFNPATVESLMCRHLVSVDWRGYLYDCDFNQMLDIPMAAGKRRQLWGMTKEQLQNGSIALGKHCFGCTAGAGSSCSGALT